MPTTTTPAMQALAKAGKDLARANEKRDTAIKRLREAIRAADAEGGHTRQDLWRASGVARQTVYDALRPDPVPGSVPDPLTGAPLPTEPPTPAQAAAEQAALDHPVGATS